MNIYIYYLLLFEFFLKINFYINIFIILLYISFKNIKILEFIPYDHYLY